LDKIKLLFKGKKILITGGTGSLGKALTTRLLKEDVDTIRIFSRDELKQIEMQSKFHDKRLRFLIGDIRDKERLSTALEDIDIVFHAAALKHVPIAEYNPFEAVKTNVNGAQNLIDASFDNDVEMVIAIGTDKAVSPLNTYGATKLLMERLFVSANFSRGNHKTKFLCVRYGNVLGSRGSVVPYFVNLINKNKTIPITDPSMTRFNITMDQALDLIFRVAKNGHGGEVFIPKLKAYRLDILRDSILDILDSQVDTEITGVRSGEKFHEILISHDEIRNTYEIEDDYVLFDKTLVINDDVSYLKNSKLKNQYSSNLVEILSQDELKSILSSENLI
jgi:UDP-N-acetylglucosamine 4,6-dehydratase/5-epimerase